VPKHVQSIHVYILSNDRVTLYIGVTSNLPARIQQHKAGAPGSFTKRYHVWKLVYVEGLESACAAIEREKQIKRWRRSKKLALIARDNPNLLEIPPS